MTGDARQLASCHADVGCITCADEGVEMRIGEVGADGLARCVGADGAEATADVSLVAPVAPGDWILAHAGVAIARLGA